MTVQFPITKIPYWLTFARGLKKGYKNIIKLFSHKSWQLNYETVKCIYGALIGSVFIYLSCIYRLAQLHPYDLSPEQSTTIRKSTDTLPRQLVINNMCISCFQSILFQNQVNKEKRKLLPCLLYLESGRRLDKGIGVIWFCSHKANCEL